MKSLIFLVKRIVAQYNWIYKLLISSESARKFVDENTQLLIDGFPRSANSFALHYIIRMQRGNLDMNNVAHHLHNASQYKEAVKLGIPAVILLRNPKDSCISLVLREKNTTLITSQIYYWLFNRSLLDKKYRDSIEILTFEDAINGKYSHLVNKVNKRFNTSYNNEELNQAEISALKERLYEINEQQFSGNELGLALPNEEKKSQKGIIEKKLVKGINYLLLKINIRLYRNILESYNLLQ